jgi:hypothetical protein
MPAGLAAAGLALGDLVQLAVVTGRMAALSSAGSGDDQAAPHQAISLRDLRTIITSSRRCDMGQHLWERRGRRFAELSLR